MRMVDRDGRHVEVILLDRGHGPQQWIRVSWNGILLGPGAAYAGIGAGYYRTVVSALRHVDVESLVEVIPLPVTRQEPTVPDLDSAQVWADAITLDMQRTGYDPDRLVELGIERGHMCAVTLDLGHPDTDLEHGVVVSSGGWVVGYDGSVDAWTPR